MKEKLRQISQRRKWAHRRLLDMGSDTYKAFLDMEQAAFAEGVLSAKAKELMALAISVVINCESCMQWHLTQAYELGASQGEILESLEVAMEMGGGPATAHARFALEVLKDLSAEKPRA